MFRVTVYVAFGEGYPTHRIGAGRGIGISKSPLKAYKQAYRQACRDAEGQTPNCTSWGEIIRLSEQVNTQTGKVSLMDDWKGTRHEPTPWW